MPCGQARPVIGDIERERAVDRHAAVELHAHRAGLDRVAPEIDQHAEHLVAVGVDQDVARHRVVPARAVVGEQADDAADLLDQIAHRERRALRLRQVVARVVERLAAQRHGAVDRRDHGRCQAAHIGVA